MKTGDVADLFGVCVATVRRWAKAGLIPSHTLPSGRVIFFRSELEPLVPGSEPTTEASS